MPPVSQRAPDLLGGVSQQAPHLRRPNELEESLNAYHSPARGFGKRPNTNHLAQLATNPNDYAGAAIFPLDYGLGQKFFAAFRNGDLRVWDENGVAQSVFFPNGKGYLNTEAARLLQTSDPFNNTDGTFLENHVSPTGVGWRLVSPTSGQSHFQIHGNRVEGIWPDPTFENHFVLDFPMPTANYTVSARAATKSPTSEAATTVFMLKARGNLVDKAGYVLRLVWTQNVQAQLGRLTPQGGFSVLGTPMQLGIDPRGENFHKYSLRVTGFFLEALVDDEVVMTATDVGNAIPDAGYPGLVSSGQTSVDRLTVMDDFTVAWEEQLPNDDPGIFRAASVGRRTFIANRNRIVARDTTRKAEVQVPQAVLYVEQADYSTTYEVTIDGTTVTYETQPGTDAGARQQISTDKITQAIRERLAATFTDFTFEQFGSMLLVKRADGEDFSISASDGLADNGLRAVKGSVQRSADLPLRCVEGFILEVVGDPEQARDNYWVRFDTDGSDDFRGVWKECARPGEGIAFDASTMPHELVYGNTLTPEMESAGFPSAPVVSLAKPTRDEDMWSFEHNGDDIVGIHLATLVMTAHERALYTNLEDTNGGPIRFGFGYTVNTTKLSADDSIAIHVEHNDGPSGTNWTTVATLTFAPGLYLKDQVFETDISTPIGVDWDVRLRMEYASGATPSDGDRRARFWPSRKPWYYNYSARDLTWRSSATYPAGTEWQITVDGSPVTYEQPSDMTGAEIAAAVEPLIEALSGVDAEILTNTHGGTSVRITKSGGGLPTVTVLSSFDSATTFWNPEVDLGYAEDALIGYTLRNLSDGSEGRIIANTSSQIIVDSLSGGVENIFRHGDLCVVVGDADVFTFRQVRWKEREAGSTVTNPWPSFVGESIRDVFYHRGRLGVLAAGSVCLSETNSLDNFFRTVTTDLIDTDPIDVTWAGGANVQFHTAVPWNGEIVLFGDRLQVVPRGEPVLSPKTIRLEMLAAYPCDPSARPVPAGRWVFFGRPLSSSTQVQALGISPRTRVAEAKPLAADLPTYLSGEPVMFAADPVLNQLFVVTDSDQRNLFHLHYTMNDDEPPVFSWGKWTFTGEILGMDISDGVLRLLLRYSDGVYLESLDLSENY